MDHFNVTVQKDGAVVSTRRGLQVSKHKYHGISFVNTTGPVQPAGGGAGGARGGSLQQHASAASADASAATPAASFSAFSITTPRTPRPRGPPKTHAAPATPGSTNGSTNGSTRGSARRKSRLNDGSASDAQTKPVVHRWKLAKPPAATTTTATTTTPPTTKKGKQEPARPPSPRRTPPTISDDTHAPSLASPSLPSPLSTSPASHVDSHFDSPLIPGGAGSNSSTNSSTTSSPRGFFDGLSPPSLESGDETGQGEDSGSSAHGGTPDGRLARRHGSHSPRAGRSGSNSNSSTSSSRNSISRYRSAVALAASCRQVARSLPTWSMCYVPQLSGPEQRVFHQFFQLIPRKLFPFEDLLQYNPSRSSEFYWMVVQDRAAVRCVLLCGAMFRAVLGGTSISEDLSQEVANVCRIVSQQLARYQMEEGAEAQEKQDDDDDNDTKGARQRRQLEGPLGGRQPKTGQPHPPRQQLRVARKRRPVPTMTLECITTLALMGSSTGRYDHWHVHMQALRAMVDAEHAADWAADVRPALLSKMRKTDLKGAMALAILPYLPFVARRFANASDAVLLDVTRDALVQATTALLTAPTPTAPTTPTTPTTPTPPLVTPAVAATIADLCVFVQAVQLAADLAKTATPMPLDPFCFAEELYWIQYRLVTQPGPLRQLASPAHRAATAAAEIGLLLPLDTTRLETDSYVRNHRAPLAAALLVPAALAPGTSDLEPALRICAMLYLKEYLPDFPRNLGGYAILLHLLRCHLERLAPAAVSADAVDAADAADAADDATLPQRLLRDPNARALLLWLCLVGDTVSRLADATEQRVDPAEQYDRRVFRARLADLVRTNPGGGDSGDSGDSLPDSDLALCQLLNVGALWHLGDNRQWDARQAVSRILQEQSACM